MENLIEGFIGVLAIIALLVVGFLFGLSSWGKHEAKHARHVCSPNGTVWVCYDVFTDTLGTEPYIAVDSLGTRIKIR